MKDRLTLFNDIIDQAGVEFYVKGKVVYIKPKIGTDLATVVRKGFNLADAEIQTDNSSFATYGRGFGAYSNPDDVTSQRLSVAYKSPLYDYYYPKFGAIEAQPVVDERYTITSNLLAAVTERGDKSWSVSLTLSLVDLQTAGYDYAMATAGDSITVIDEKLAFSEVVRIVKVVSDYNGEGDRINTQVTCGSLSFADKQKTSQATLANVAAGKTSVPNSWLTQQVQVATNDLLSARTELQFTDAGIIATDKSDANKVVLLNSSGLGVSLDGGQTFKTAITADAIDGDNINITNINAINIVAGTIKENNLSIDLDTGDVVFRRGKIVGNDGLIRFDMDQSYLESKNTSGYGFKIYQGIFMFEKGDTIIGTLVPFLENNLGLGLSSHGALMLSAYDASTDSSKPSINMIQEDGMQITGDKISIGNSFSDTSKLNALFSNTDIAGNVDMAGKLDVGKKLIVYGDFNTIGTKNAIVATRDGVRAVSAYETAESYFGDIGESKTDDTMSVKVPIEELFGDTVNTAVSYQVFLQSYSSAHVWVSSRDEAFFVVESDQPNTPFVWEIKAKRRGYESDRLVKDDITYNELKKHVVPGEQNTEPIDEGSEDND